VILVSEVVFSLRMCTVFNNSQILNLNLQNPFFFIRILIAYSVTEALLSKNPSSSYKSRARYLKENHLFNLEIQKLNSEVELLKFGGDRSDWSLIITWQTSNKREISLE